MSNIVPNGLPSDGPPIKKEPSQPPAEIPRPDVALRVEIFRQPGTARPALLKWEIVGTNTAFHERGSVQNELAAVCYDLNARILRAISEDFHQHLRDGKK